MNKNLFLQTVKPITMTSKERIDCLYDSLEHIRINNIDGDFVECGVWKGGNILGIMEYLNYHKMYDRKVWVYDTFLGMTEPENIDIDLNGNSAKSMLENIMCISTIDEFKKNIENTKFPVDNLKIIIGDICETLKNKNNIPDKISLLRLDTDWYKSTKIELEMLYPNLKNDGILIVDDYGHWSGSKKAVNEYFENKKINISQIDYTGIKIIKNESI